MFRLRGSGTSSFAVRLVSHIPRSAWDPSHYHENWTDSYGTPIAERRQWPSKRWSVGLTPSTPREWLQYSPRNLAYAYNGALRACGTDFRKMVSLYKEMKKRGVQVDVDTLHILLTRGARYESVAPDDLFLLLEELVQLGAKPDMAAIETLHTVWDHSSGMPVEWLSARKKQLIELYDHIADETIHRLSHANHPQYQLAPHLDHLLAQEMMRLRGNLKQLNARLSPRVYRKYFHVIQSSSLLLNELHQFLWEYVPADHPSIFIKGLNLRFPFIASILRRPPLSEGNEAHAQDGQRRHHSGGVSNGGGSGSGGPATSAESPLRSRAAQAILNAVTEIPSTSSSTTTALAVLLPSHFEDYEVCSVFLSAVERVVEADFSVDNLQSSSLSFRRLLHRRLFLSILSILESTGMLFTSDLMAQLMDLVKYSEEDLTRDADARRVLRYALRGSCASRYEAARRAWQSIQPVADGRVVGRYIASRHPWTRSAIMCDHQLHFKATYPSAAPGPRRGATGSKNEREEDEDGMVNDEQGKGEANNNKGEEDGNASGSGTAVVKAVPATLSTSTSSLLEVWYTVEGFNRRWADVQALIQHTRVLTSPIPPFILNSSSSSSSSLDPRSDPSLPPSVLPLHDRIMRVNEYLEGAMEVFTGQMVFLRTLVTGYRYDTLEEALHTQAQGGDAVSSSSTSEDSPHQKGVEEGGAGGASSRVRAGAANNNNNNNNNNAMRGMNTISVPLLPLSVWQRVFQALEETYSAMEEFMVKYQHCPLVPETASPLLSTTTGSNMSDCGLHDDARPSSSPPVPNTAAYTPPEPEFECWEAMLIILHHILDYCAAARQRSVRFTGQGGEGAELTSQGMEGGNKAVGLHHEETLVVLEQQDRGEEEALRHPEVIHVLFSKAAAFRTRLVEESRTRFNGKFRLLWLQEVSMNALASSLLGNPGGGGMGSGDANAPPSFGPGGGGGLPGVMNPKLLQSLPTIFSVLGNLASAFVGFVFTLVFFFCFVGPTSFRSDIAPVAGFHIVVLFLWREVHDHFMNGIKVIRQMKEQNQQKQQLEKDISMSFKTSLD